MHATKWLIPVLTAILASPVFAQNLEQRLESRYKLTTINAEGDIVTQGATLVLKAGGLIAGPMSSCNSDFKDGKFSLGKVAKATCNNASKIPGIGLIPGVNRVAGNTQVTRGFVAGEKLYDTKIDVKEDGIVFIVISDPIPDTRYHAEIKFPFKKGSPPDFATADRMIAEAFKVSAGGGAGAPVQTTSVTPAPTYATPVPTSPVFAPIAPPPPPPDAGLTPIPAPKPVALNPVKTPALPPVQTPQPPADQSTVLPAIAPPAPPPDQPAVPPPNPAGMSKGMLMGIGMGLLVLLAAGAFLALKMRGNSGAVPSQPPPPLPEMMYQQAPPPPPVPAPWPSAAPAPVYAAAPAPPAPGPTLPFPLIQPAPLIRTPSHRLEELKVLLDLGILSDAEFEAERAKLEPAELETARPEAAWPEPAPAEVTRLYDPSPAAVEQTRMNEPAEADPLSATVPVPIRYQHPPAAATLPPTVPAPPPANVSVPAPATLSLGQTEAQVLAILGQPNNVVDLGSKRILVFPSLKVTFKDGVLADVD